MGLHHGVYCLGCCWLLVLVLVPIGVMNLAAMLMVTLLVFAEKVMPWGRAASRVGALVLVLYGTSVTIGRDCCPPWPKATNGAGRCYITSERVPETLARQGSGRSISGDM